MDLHRLKVTGNKLYLDGFELKGMCAFKYELSGREVPMLTVTLGIEDINAPETEAPAITGKAFAVPTAADIDKINEALIKLENALI